MDQPMNYGAQGFGIPNGSPVESHGTKRRLVDTMANLELSPARPKKRRIRKKSIFGSLENTPIGGYETTNNPDKIIIRDIDQFLRDNDSKQISKKKFDIAKRIDNVEDVDLEKLVIPDLGKNTKLREYIAKRLVQARVNKSPDQLDANEKDESLYYLRKYIEDYMSVLKYYNPQLLIWYLYMAAKTHEYDNDDGKIVELDNDGDEPMSPIDEPIENRTEFSNDYAYNVGQASSIYEDADAMSIDG